jgi:hypothetical protein
MRMFTHSPTSGRRRSPARGPVRLAMLLSGAAIAGLQWLGETATCTDLGGMPAADFHPTHDARIFNFIPVLGLTRNPLNRRAAAARRPHS